ncbi:putative ribonuclease H-like domain-containing protein, partial [Tanacetum coccineum]
ISRKVPQISHLKPFGCQVTILNTSDYLGKFEGKADDGYLVGYASNSKAYRVYNLPNKRVEETLNLRFLEDKPNVQGIGHEWYFDLDYLTDSLGYTRFKTDTPAGTHETNNNTGSSSSNGPSIMERNADYAEELAKLQRQEYEAKDAAARYGYLFSQETAEILSQAEAEVRNQCVSADMDPAGIASAGSDPAGGNPAGSSQSAGSDPAGGNPAGSSQSAGSDPAGGNPAGSSQPAGSDEPAGKGNPAVSTSVSADFIPIHADESILPPGQPLGSSENSTQFPVPSDVNEQFINQKVWTLVPLPAGKNAIGTKWILKNKRDAKGIVVRNKERWMLRVPFSMERLREVYVTQPKGFEDPYFPKHVYRVVKALYGLHQAPRACQDQVMFKDMLTKFDMESVRTATTPYEAAKTKLKDETDPPVNSSWVCEWDFDYKQAYGLAGIDQCMNDVAAQGCDTGRVAVEETGQDCNSTQRHSKIGLQVMETSSQLLVMISKSSRDDIRILIDNVKLTDSEEARRRFTG